MRINLGLAAAAAVTTALVGAVPGTAHAEAGRVTVAASTPKAANGARVSEPLRYAIEHLPGAPSRPAGYERTKFKVWDDANHNCRDTRAEVLVSESYTSTSGGCTIRSGDWYSYYDATWHTVAHSLDIDHLVPLEEAWASGARSWSATRREAYANDLGDPRTLVAVSSSANRSKGDRDPSEWLPAYGKCKYVAQWVAVKLRWSLRVNHPERVALERVASGCTNVTVTTHRARIVSTVAPQASTGGGSTSTSGGGSTPAPTTHACTTTSSGSCIRGGGFCPQASYGQVGYDAYGNRYVCTGDSTHPHWE